MPKILFSFICLELALICLVSFILSGGRCVVWSSCLCEMGGAGLQTTVALSHRKYHFVDALITVLHKGGVTQNAILCPLKCHNIVALSHSSIMLPLNCCVSVALSQRKFHSVCLLDCNSTMVPSLLQDLIATPWQL